MNSNVKFTEQELETIHSNYKIKAIKLLRGRLGLGLKEAKDVVEEYMNQNSHLIQHHRSSGGFQFLAFLLLLAAAVWYFGFSSASNLG